MPPIVRVAMFMIALVLALDAFAPERHDKLRVDGHATSSHWSLSHLRRRTAYRLHFSGDRAVSCDVGNAAYDALRDGDRVAVDRSRVFDACDGITRGGEVISAPNVRKWAMTIPIAILLAGAFGWVDLFARRGGGRGRGWRSA